MTLREFVEAAQKLPPEALDCEVGIVTDNVGSGEHISDVEGIRFCNKSLLSTPWVEIIYSE